MLKKAYIEIGNICNLKCKFCPGTKREAKFMTAREFEHIAQKIRPHTQYIYLHLMGEPLLHPELEKILDIAQRLDFKVIVTTNGTLLGRRGASLLSSGSVHKINISLQSFEGNGEGDPGEYISLCVDFAKAAERAGKPCILRLWNKGGFDTLNGEILCALEEAFPKPWTESRGSMRIAGKVWLEEGERFDWPDMVAQDRGEDCFCRGLRDQIGVLCDGTVVPCCLDHEGDIALGNLFESEIKEIMSTERAHRIYEGFTARKAVEPLCQRCGYARRFT